MQTELSTIVQNSEGSKVFLCKKSESLKKGLWQFCVVTDLFSPPSFTPK